MVFDTHSTTNDASRRPPAIGNVKIREPSRQGDRRRRGFNLATLRRLEAPKRPDPNIPTIGALRSLPMASNLRRRGRLVWWMRPNATGQSLYRTATAADYGRSWRCVVTETVYNRLIKGDPSDSQTTRASDPITVPITPPAAGRHDPRGPTCARSTSCRDRSKAWKHYRITYTDQWGDKGVASSSRPTRTSYRAFTYSFRDDGKACFVATGFAPETAYTISLSPIQVRRGGGPGHGHHAQKTSSTRVQVSTAERSVEAGASDTVSFSTVVAK